MHFPNDLTSLKELIVSLPQQKIAQSISVLLAGYIAFLAAEFTWLLVEPAPTLSNKVLNVKVSDNKSTKTINTQKIQKLNLFGDYNGVVEQPSADDITDAPETKLDLVLAGAVATNNKNTSAAIIERRGEQETYGIGEKIKGTQATLEKVFHDRVIINLSGNLETLMLDGFDFNSKTEARKPVTPAKKVERKLGTGNAKKIDQRSNSELRRQAVALKSDINEDPSKIGDYLRISTKKQNNNIVGYRLRPGKNPEFFKQAGLITGDVAIEMNGYDLTNPLDAAQALQALKQEQEISLLIDRNGEMTEILFSVY